LDGKTIFDAALANMFVIFFVINKPTIYLWQDIKISDLWAFLSDDYLVVAHVGLLCILIARIMTGDR
jgi:hypothetical protein